MIPSIRLIPLLIVLLVLTGCADAPNIYTMKPSKLESIRADISTIGVYMLPDLPKTLVLRPAKGAWGGFRRGVFVGASLPVMIGFVSPVPGGTFLGLLVSPAGALVGGVYGVYTAVPVDEVTQAEMMLIIASDNLKNEGLREDLIDNVVELGNRHTSLMFVEWPETNDHEIAQASETLVERIDAKLTIQVEQVGLRGIYSIDPPVDTFIQVRVRLIGQQGDAILLDERFICASDQERGFKDWADHNGSDFSDEFRSCVTEFAEKIVDDFFRVYPMKWSY